MSELEKILYDTEELRERIREQYRTVEGEEQPWTNPLWIALNHLEDAHHWLQEAMDEPELLRRLGQ